MAAASASARGLEPAGPLFLLSFGQRDELAASIGRLGWQVLASRRLEGSARRLSASMASVVVVDSRGEPEKAIKAIQKLAREDGSTVLIYSKAEKHIINAALHEGVTHLLRAPFLNVELEAALRLAERAAPLRDDRPRTPASRDQLTNLPLIADLRDWLGKEMGAAQVSLLLVNISRFDAINASFGREVGDASLRALAHRIEPLVDEFGDVARIMTRMPGAEFAIAVSGAVSPDRLQLLAEVIVEAVSRPFGTEGGQVRLGCRIAVVQSAARHKGAASLIREAGGLLGEIRDADSGAIRIQLGEQGERASMTKSLHADLRSALAKEEIELLFQPQVGVASGAIVGVEALARWKHPVRGTLGAATLFAVAEQSNYMVELSAHIHRKALFAAARWPAALSHLRLAINVTAADIARPRFAKSLQAMIDESGFPRQRLTVEVTETGLMENLDAAARTLSQFRVSGCRVAIDDFGTGYSSLAWLQHLPADYLKIDKGLSSEILGAERDAIVLRGVIGMARSLGLTVISEGVETEAQLTLLAREGCGLYQGFLFSPPIDAPALEKMVRRRN